MLFTYTTLKYISSYLKPGLQIIIFIFPYRQENI